MIAIKNIGTQEFTSLEYGCFCGHISKSILQILKYKINR